MSGPKLVGITCDPEVIARNQERLERVGKEKYFSAMFKNLNVDIENVETWIENYAKSTITKVPDDYGDSAGILREIVELKNEHITKINSEIIKMTIIKKMTPKELNKYAADKVKAIPKWKKDFIDEVSELLRKLQDDVAYYENESMKRENANAIHEKKLEELAKRSKSISKYIQSAEMDVIHIEGYAGDSRNIPFAPEKKRVVDADTLPFSLDELALIEMFQMDINEFAKCRYLGDKEHELINEFKEDIERVNVENLIYPMRSKRAILNRMKMDYLSLSKKVASLTAAYNSEQERRSTLVIEYTTFCSALGQEVDDYTIWTDEKLQKEVSWLKEKVKEQENRIYVEDTIEEIMGNYGYSSISSHNLHEADKTSQIIFEDNSGAKISTSFGDGMVLMHVVGEGTNVPSQQEINEQIQQQGAFCDLYPKIKEQLKKKGINITSESLMPVSEKYVTNVKIERQKDIKTTTNRFSFRHIPSISEVDYDYERFSESNSNLQYADMEES